MNKVAAASVLFLIATAAVFYLFRNADDSTPESVSGTKRDQRSPTRPSAIANGMARSQLAGSQRPPQTPQQKSLATLRHALARSNDLLKFRDSLGEIADLTAQDRLYYAAAIDEFCHGAAARAGWADAAKIYDWGDGNPLDIPSRFGITAKRDVSPQPGDPKKTIRDEARKRWQENSGATLCAGYKARPVNADDIRQRLRAAIDAGDPRAIAMLADIEFRESAKPIDWSKFNNKSGKPLPNIGNEVADPTIEYTAKLAAAMSTRDPSAILSFGPLFGQSYLTGEYTFANEALSAGLKLDMWQLIACEFGAPCGSDNNAVLLRACAVDGLCEIGDLESYFLSYRFNKVEVEQYRRLKPLVIAAIQSGDWSFMRFGNASLPPGTTQGTSIKSPFRIPARLGR